MSDKAREVEEIINRALYSEMCVPEVDGPFDNGQWGDQYPKAILAALAGADLVIVPTIRLETAFVAGFGLSGEGYNGEYPFENYEPGRMRVELKPQFDAWLAAISTTPPAGAKTET